MDEIVEIANYGTAFSAEIAVAHLDSLGIKASVATDSAGGAIPSLTRLSGGAKVLVLSEDAERARAALADFEADEDEA